MVGELVLLTGGTGFLGYTILVDLLNSGYRVRVAARSQAKIDKVRAAASVSALNPSETQLMFVLVPDMTATGAYDEAVQGVDFIIHAAAPLQAKGEDGSTPTKDQLEALLVTASVNGNIGILQSAHEKSKSVKRVVMTSSTVAIAPAEVYVTDLANEREVTRGPDSRVVAPPPPYSSGLQAYCVGKAAALNAAEAFIRDNATSFDLISIMPSWIFGKDEFLTSTKDIQTSTGSTNVLINRLLSGNQAAAAVGNAVLCADVARAHVRALDLGIGGNQSFLLNIESKWEDTIPITKKLFPGAFESGLFQESDPQPTLPIKWDASKTREILGIDLAGYEVMIKEVVGQYLELARQEGKLE